MNARTAEGRTWVSTIAFLCVVGLLAAVGLAFALNRPGVNRYSALLTSVVGLYPHSDVRELGVPVGAIDSLTPVGRLVRVDFHVNRDVPVPAGVIAAVVAPSVVSDRYLQLAPVYTGGPTLAPGAVIPPGRTASPPEFDDLLANVHKLATSLGPQGVNNTGALSEALATLGRNLDGNGQRVNTTLDNLSQAVTTLSASRDNLAGTVVNLQSFTTNLSRNDAGVRAFTLQFAQVSGYLADERKDLGDTLRTLSRTLGEVAGFVHDNRSRIRSNVDQLSEVLTTVNGERLSLEQSLDVAPMGLDGLVNAYNASSGTLDTRPALLPMLLCTVYGLPLPQQVKDALTPPLNTLLPGGLAGCANSAARSPLRLPALSAADTDALQKLVTPSLAPRPGGGR